MDFPLLLSNVKYNSQAPDESFCSLNSVKLSSDLASPSICKAEILAGDNN